MERGSKEQAAALYQKVAGFRVDPVVISDAIDQACAADILKYDRDELEDRLSDDDHSAVLLKEATDVVILVTGALEAESIEVYRDFVLQVEDQGSLDAFDDVSETLRRVMARSMAEHALDDVTANRGVVLANLRVGLAMLGDREPFHPEESLDGSSIAAA